jgi:phosphoribosylamine--glycine ligase
MLNSVSETIIAPTIAGMAAEGNPYKGFLYVGLMMTSAGPKVVEYNCRFGDPECQVVIPRLRSDLLTHLVQSAQGELLGKDIVFDQQYRTTVVLVSGGYPVSYEKGFPIFGLDELEKVEAVQVFHAGTKEQDGQLCTAGGRVLNVVGTGPTLQESISMAYKGLESISFEGMFYRKDIGAKGLNHVS